MTAIEAKLDALMNKLGNNERRMHTALDVGAVDEGEKRKSDDEGLTHDGSYQFEEAQYLNANKSYTFKPNLNLPTHYTPALRTSHMGEKRSKVKDLDRICSNIMP